MVIALMVAVGLLLLGVVCWVFDELDRRRRLKRWQDVYGLSEPKRRVPRQRVR